MKKNKTDKAVLVCQKVKTILQAFSAIHDFFSQVDWKCFSDIPEHSDAVIPEPMKLIKAMGTIIR